MCSITNSRINSSEFITRDRETDITAMLYSRDRYRLTRAVLCVCVCVCVYGRNRRTSAARCAMLAAYLARLLSMYCCGVGYGPSTPPAPPGC